MEAMARKSVARDAVLDAFEGLLIDIGERAATLDAVATRAGVSEGGLLYHFPNKEALITASLERLDHLAAEDLARCMGNGHISTPCGRAGRPATPRSGRRM